MPVAERRLRLVRALHVGAPSIAHSVNARACKLVIVCKSGGLVGAARSLRSLCLHHARSPV